MKKLWIVLCLLTLTQTVSYGQGKLKQLRKEYIIRRLNLSTEQKTKFTPVFDQYWENLDAVRKEKRALRIEGASFTATDAELLADIDKMMNLHQKELDIEKEYINKFKTTLNPRQLVEFFRANKDFNKKLLDKLQEN